MSYSTVVKNELKHLRGTHTLGCLPELNIKRAVVGYRRLILGGSRFGCLRINSLRLNLILFCNVHAILAGR